MQKRVEKKILKILNKALSEREKNTADLSVANLHDLTKIYKELKNIKESEINNNEPQGVVILPAVEIERIDNQYE